MSFARNSGGGPGEWLAGRIETPDDVLGRPAIVLLPEIAVRLLSIVVIPWRETKRPGCAR